MFAYGIEFNVSNADVLDKFAKPIEHAHLVDLKDIILHLG